MAAYYERLSHRKTITIVTSDRLGPTRSMRIFSKRFGIGRGSEDRLLFQNLLIYRGASEKQIKTNVGLLAFSGHERSVPPVSRIYQIEFS